MAIEQPRARRVRIRKVGRVIGTQSEYCEPCVIMDLSETGALLLVDGKPPPDSVYLLQRQSCVLRQAAVVRRGPKAVGVQFTGAVEQLTADDARLRLWLS